MAQTIKLKRSSVSGNTPGTSDLELGEVAINTYDGKMFIKKNDGSDSIVEIGGTSGTVTEAFKTIAVSGQSSVVADSATDTLTLVAGSNMTLTTNASGDTITFASSGGGGTQNVFTTFAVSGQSSVVADSTTDTLTLVAGSGITLTTDNSNDEITITNSATGANAFGNIAVSGQTTVAADSTNDTLTLTAGTGITLTTDATNDGITITNSATGANAFGNIAVSGQSTVAADSTNDTVTFVAGSNMTITTNASGDTVTFASSGGGGSQNVFSNIGVSGQGTIQADATTDTLTFEAGTGISLTTDTTNDKLTITATGGTSNVANAASSIKEFKYDISSSTTTITGSDANSNTLAYEAGAIQVFLNGILLDPATDYTASNGSSVVLTDAAVSGDDVQIVAFNRKIVTANVGLSTFTGDGTTTAFTLSSDPVNENNTRVHIDGVYQEKAAYSVSGTTLTFSGAPPNGSSIEVEIGFTQAEIGSTLDFADNAILRIGTGNDLQILHDGSDSIIKDTGTGDLQIAASTLEVKNSGLSETMLKAIEDGAVELYFDNSKKLETVTGGVTITGTVTATTFSGDLSGTINTATTGTTQSASDNSTKIATTAYVDTAVTNLVDSAPGTLNTLNELAAALGDDANFSTTITNSLNLKVGRDSATGAASIPAGTTAQRPGSPAAGQFRYNSTLSQFEGYTTTWGAIGGGGTNTFTTDVFTSSGSAAFTLTQAVASPNDCIVHIDGIYQTPTDAYTVSGTTLTFTATPASGRKVVVYSVKAGVSGNNLNVQTINGNGSDHTFTLNVNPINENNTIVHIDGVYQQKSSYTVSGTSLSFGSGNIPANGTVIEVATFTQTEINVPVNDTIDTVHIKDDAVTSAKLGGNLTMPGNISLADDAQAVFGADSDIKIFHQSSSGANYLQSFTNTELRIESNGNTKILTNNGDNMAVFTKDGAVTLYHDNAAKLATASGGVTITGTLTATTLAGTLSTAAQTNITSVGTLTNFTTSGFAKADNYQFYQNSSATGATDAIYRKTTATLAFKTGSTERMTLDGSGNLAVTGTIATGGITINGAGSTISDSSDLGIVSGGDLTLDVASDIILDADGGDFKFRDGGAGFFTISNSSLDAVLKVEQSNEDFIIKGNDGGSEITALTLDMSNAGRANFNGNVGIGGFPDSDSGLHLKGDGRRILVDSDDYNLVSLGRRGSSGTGLDKAYLRMKNAGTNTVVIDTDGPTYFNGGSVGIGTGTNVDELLHIEKSSGTTLVKTEVAANSIVGFQITKTNATTQAWRIVDGQTVNGVLEFYDLTNSATRMAIKSDGSVGINETNPSGKLQITDGNNYAKFGDFHSNSTMVLQMADSAGFPVEVQAYSSELRFNTTPTSGATPVSRMHIQNDGHIRVNPGAADYDGHTNVDQYLFSVQTSYNSNGDQNLNIVNHNGNWQDGTSGTDSAYGLMWGYQNNIRAGIHYDHRGTEKFDFYSGYGSMRFRVRTSAAANQSPIGSETVMPPALTIIPGGNVGIGTARGGITPSASLHVAGENNGYDGTIRIGERGYLAHRDAGQTKTWVANNYNNNSASFGIRMKGIADTDEKLTVLGSGRVGIGKDNPAAKLHVESTGSATYSGSSAGSNIALYLTNAESGAAGRTVGLAMVSESNAEIYLNAVTAANNNGGDFTIASRNGGTRAEKMRVHAAGSVTKPLNPSFSARYPAVTAGGNATIVFSSTHHNIGSHYNTSTGVFTAPVAGSYFFSFSILIDPSGLGYYARILFSKNGTSASTTYGDTLESTEYQTTVQEYQSLQMSAVIYLNANDTMRLQNTGQSPTYGTSYGSFNGYLLG